MAISVDAITKVITIPKADLTEISDPLYELDVNDLHLWLRDWEDSEDGMPCPQTHNHFGEITLAGLTYARVVEMLSPYTVEFEDGQYIVGCTGGNHNLSDVKVANQVSLIINNSAGLIVSGSALTSTEQTKLDELYKIMGLDSGNPMTVTPTSRAAGSVSQTISGDGETTTTVTRN